MKKVSTFIIISLFLFALLACGAEQKTTTRHLSQHKLSTGMTVVVAEGELEPRSIGSYSIRIYGANPKFPTDEFLCGTVWTRDGVIEKVITQDINADGVEEIIIIIRSAGSGGYLSADAFQYQLKQVRLIANVANLGENVDLIRELSNILESK